jgi:Icc-related predicted phosphoesterase
MIKIACISDSHNQHRSIEIPKCDVLIHAGDYSYTGDFQSLWEINQWFGKLKKDGVCSEVVTVCGNHDFLFEKNPTLARSIMTNCIYLQDEPLEFMGYRWYGSPRTPFFNSWAFNEQRGAEIKKWWAKIPENTQILVTHGPPFGILDVNTEEPYHKHLGPEHLGCEELRKRVDQLKDLRLHCMGHIHSSHGEEVIDGVKFVNASVLNESYKVVYKPIVVEL